MSNASRTSVTTGFVTIRGIPRCTSRRSIVFWSVRIGRRHRARGVEAGDGIVWFWIGSHTQYDRLVGSTLTDRIAPQIPIFSISSTVTSSAVRS